MDDLTKNSVEKFIAFLETEFKKIKHYNLIQISEWSLNDFKVKIKFFYKEKNDVVFADIREIKENQHDFRHLLDNILDQIAEKVQL